MTIKPAGAHEPLKAEPASILSKAFDLLRAFNASERVMTLSELSRAANLPKSTVHRLLARLVALDVVEHHGDGYRLGLSLIQLGAVTPAARMRELAAPHLGSLHSFTGHTVHLAVLRKFDVVYLEKLSSGEPDDTLSNVGGRLPANCTAVGKALLAYSDFAALPSALPQMTPYSIGDRAALIRQLREVKDRGVAHADQEAQLNVSCTAAPILVAGIAVGAISLSFATGSESKATVEESVRATARRITIDARAQSLTTDRWLPADPQDGLLNQRPR